MRVITFNANGIRSAASKGFFDLAGRTEHRCGLPSGNQGPQPAVAARSPTIRPAITAITTTPSARATAESPLFARREPDEVRTGLGWPECDAEGRWLEARFGTLSVVSLVPALRLLQPRTAGGEIRLSGALAEPLRAMRASGRDYILCGDWNIAHKEIDLKNWRANRNHSGFLPEERAWMDELFGPLGWVDAFRVVNPEPDQYTWWSNRGRARDKNVGWRIDYQVITPGLAEKVRAAAIYRDQRFSDHAPLTHGLRVCLLKPLPGVPAATSCEFFSAGGCWPRC
jgi:exodeoxyribonuclease-3